VPSLPPPCASRSTIPPDPAERDTLVHDFAHPTKRSSGPCHWRLPRHRRGSRARLRSQRRSGRHYGNSSDHAEQVLAGLEGAGHCLVQADLMDPVAIKAAVDDAADALGRIDILINNAGVFFPHPIQDVDYVTWQRAWEQTIGINLIGAANVAWCALQHMPRTSGSRIINIGSRGAFRGEPKNPAYGASKAAIAAFGQSIAKALGSQGIAVTTLAPGFVETDMAADQLTGPRGDEIRAQSPFDRVPSPEEVADAVLYLASAGAEWVSGAVLDFNGASYLRM